MIQLRCPKSGTVFTADESARGSSVLCPHCGGSHWVSSRTGAPVKPAPAAATPADTDALAPEAMPAPPRVVGGGLEAAMKSSVGLCVNHPDSPAAGRCRRCRKALCETCSFMSGTERFCGDCAGTPDEGRVERQRNRGRWSIVCGGLAIAVLVGTVVVAAANASARGSADKASELLAGCGVLASVLLAGTGLAMGLASRDKQLGGTVAGVVGIVVSSIGLGLFVLLWLAGVMMGNG
jgi:hypothetical protein